MAPDELEQQIARAVLAEEEVERLLAELAQFRAAVRSAIPEFAPGPFICGKGGAERDGLPDRLHVCPSYGTDWSAIYQRIPASDGY